MHMSGVTVYYWWSLMYRTKTSPLDWKYGNILSSFLFTYKYSTVYYSFQLFRVDMVVIYLEYLNKLY